MCSWAASRRDYFSTGIESYGRGLAAFSQLVAHHESRTATSELVVACALRATLPEFLQAAVLPHKLRIILRRYKEANNASQSNNAARRSPHETERT